MTLFAASLPATNGSARGSALRLGRTLAIGTLASLATTVEAALLDKLLDRGFLDPIVQANELYTLD